MVGLRHPSLARRLLFFLRQGLNARLSRIPRRDSVHLTGAHPLATRANPTRLDIALGFSGVSTPFGTIGLTRFYYAPLLVFIAARPFRLLFLFQPSPQHRLSYT